MTMNPAQIAIEELELGVRAYNIIKRMGIETFGDLANVSVEECNAWCAVHGQHLGLRAFTELAEAQASVLGDSLNQPNEGARTMSMKVADLLPGDKIRFSEQDPIHEVIKVERDRYGYDLLFSPCDGTAPRWRGFDNGDSVQLIEREGA